MGSFPFEGTKYEVSIDNMIRLVAENKRLREDYENREEVLDAQAKRISDLGRENAFLHGMLDRYRQMVGLPQDEIRPSATFGPWATGDGGKSRSTLRDEMAGRAMQALLEDVLRARPGVSLAEDWRAAVAQEAYRVADAMLAERAAAVAVEVKP